MSASSTPMFSKKEEVGLIIAGTTALTITVGGAIMAGFSNNQRLSQTKSNTLLYTGLALSTAPSAAILVTILLIGAGVGK